MKFHKLLVLSVLFTLKVNATDAEDLMLAPPYLVQEFYEYCSEIRPEDESDTETYMLKCVNKELTDSGYDPFTTYSELVAHMSKDDE